MLMLKTALTKTLKLVELSILLVATILMLQRISTPQAVAQEVRNDFRTLLEEENAVYEKDFNLVLETPIIGKTRFTFSADSIDIITEIGEDYVCFSQRSSGISGTLCTPLSNIQVLEIGHD